MDYKKASDIALFKSCQKDDLKAYDELFNRYVVRLHRVGMKYFSNHTIVEELTIDVLFDIWQRRQSIQIELNLSSYLFKAMHFQCLNYLRKKKLLVVDIHSVAEDKLVAQDASDHDLRHQEMAYAYQQALYHLTPQRRKVFELSREESLSYAEIARELNISKNTVEIHMSGALKTLRGFFKHFGIYLSVIASYMFWG